jgi:hypothetical protein
MYRRERELELIERRCNSTVNGLFLDSGFTTNPAVLLERQVEQVQPPQQHVPTATYHISPEASFAPHPPL